MQNKMKHCNIYKWMHYKSANYFNTISLSLGIITIILGAGAGTTVFSNLQQDSDCEGFNLTSVIIGIVITINASLNGVLTFIRPAEISEKHKNFAKEYAGIANLIEFQLSLPYTERIDGIKFSSDISEQLGILIRSSIDIPNHVWNKFREALNKNQIIFDNDTIPKMRQIKFKESTTEQSTIEQYTIEQPSYGTGISIDAKDIVRSNSEISSKTSKQSKNALQLENEFEQRLRDKLTEKQFMKIQYQLDRM